MEFTPKNQLSPEQKALRFSVILETLSAFWALFMLFYTHSMAIALDVVYSFLSAFLSGLGVLSVRFIDKGYTRKHPLGFYPYEVFISFIRSLLLMGMMIIMFANALNVLFIGGTATPLKSILFYTIPSIIFSFWGYWRSSSTLKKYPSMTLEADVNEWRSDVLITAITFIIIFIAYFLQNTSLAWIGVYADPVVVMLLCIILIRDPLILLVDSFKNLMLQSADPIFSRPFREEITLFTSKYAPKFTLNLVEVIPIGRMVWVQAEIHPDNETIPIKDFIYLETAIEKIAKKHFSHVDVSLYFGGCTRNET